MLITIVRLAGSFAIGITLNWFVNHLKKQKIRQEIKNDHYNLDAEMEISEKKEKHKLRSWLRWMRRKIRKEK